MSMSPTQLSPAGAATPVRSPMRVVLWSGLVLVLFAATVASISAWRGSIDISGPPLPLGPQVPDFSLIERSGKTVTRADLLGRVWLADFVFTRCSGPCPTLSARMHSLQLALADHPRVQLVTFTLDPENDTPAVLADYARRFHADEQRWWFLTGKDQETVHKFVEEGMKQTVIPAKGDQPIIHSEYIVIIDRAGHIRAAHGGVDAASKPLILRDVQKLLAEPPGA